MVAISSFIGMLSSTTLQQYAEPSTLQGILSLMDVGYSKVPQLIEQLSNFELNADSCHAITSWDAKQGIEKYEKQVNNWLSTYGKEDTQINSVDVGPDYLHLIEVIQKILEFYCSKFLKNGEREIAVNRNSASSFDSNTESHGNITNDFSDNEEYGEFATLTGATETNPAVVFSVPVQNDDSFSENEEYEESFNLADNGVNPVVTAEQVDDPVVGLEQVDETTDSDSVPVQNEDSFSGNEEYEESFNLADNGVNPVVTAEQVDDPVFGLEQVDETTDSDSVPVQNDDSFSENEEYGELAANDANEVVNEQGDQEFN
jgi:hypothetical protein